MNRSQTSTRSYIIATHSFLIRLVLDPDWHIHTIVVLDTEHHYGTAIIDDTLMTTIKRKNNRLDAPLLNTYLITHKAERISSVSLADGMNDVHQIAHANDGVYFANTGCNSIVYQSLDGETRHEYVIGEFPTDVNHLNSVFPCGTQIFGLLHNRYREDSELAIFDHDLRRGFELRHCIRLWHRGVHNVYLDDSYLYYSASSDGKVIVVDLATQCVVAERQFDGYTKGLSMTDYLVVGITEHATRVARFTTKGFLAVLDPVSLQQIAKVDLNHPSLPYAIGNINEIRALGPNERAQARHDPIAGPRWASMRLANGDPAHRIRAVAKTYVHRVQQRLRPQAPEKGSP